MKFIVFYMIILVVRSQLKYCFSS